MTLTREDRLKIQLTRAMAKRDLLNANYVLEKEALDEDIAKLQNELDNLETYGDMALVAEQTEPQFTEKCPFDDSLPCEWVCTEYGKCKYKPKTEREGE